MRDFLNALSTFIYRNLIFSSFESFEALLSYLSYFQLSFSKVRQSIQLKPIFFLKDSSRDHQKFNLNLVK